jgi:hypothetical protein
MLKNMIRNGLWTKEEDRLLRNI